MPTTEASLVFPMYLYDNVNPVVTAAYLPPLAAGFEQVRAVARGDDG